MQRRTWLQASMGMVCSGLAGASLPALAQGKASDFPSRPIKLLVAFPAGGPTDISMRQLAEGASKILGQPVIVENRPGASGSLPAQLLQSTPGDGYTIAQLPMSVLRLPFTTGLKWDPVDSLSYILNATGYAFCMVASQQSGFKTWADVVAWAKAHPGKLTIGNTGTYTSPHITSAMIAQQLGLDVIHVPYKGSADLMKASLGGEVMVAADTSAVAPHVQSGKLAALNVWTDKRLAVMPDTPTLKELGLPFSQYSPFGLVAPKNTPAAVVQRLHDAFKQSMEQAAYLELLKRYDMLPIYMDSAAYRRFAQEASVQEKAILAKLGPLPA